MKSHVHEGHGKPPLHLGSVSVCGQVSCMWCPGLAPRPRWPLLKDTGILRLVDLEQRGIPGSVLPSLGRAYLKVARPSVCIECTELLPASEGPRLANQTHRLRVPNLDRQGCRLGAHPNLNIGLEQLKRLCSVRQTSYWKVSLRTSPERNGKSCRFRS